MALSARLTREKVRTTVRLPRPLYDEVRQFVERDLNSAETINDFFVAAILAYVKLLRRKRIDAAYARMSEDADYQKEAKLIAERSEEHTSELQSPCNLVCRLLLEKKNK